MWGRHVNDIETIKRKMTRVLNIISKKEHRKIAENTYIYSEEDLKENTDFC